MRSPPLVLLLVMSAAFSMGGAAQVDAETSPALAVLVHHPYPDASDPLGVEFEDGADGYWSRYQHLDVDNVAGFDFPHTTFDGVLPIEGIPEGDGPYIATRDAYQAAFQQRALHESPVKLSAAIDVDGEAVHVLWDVSWMADLSGDDLRLWLAIVEDPVHYEPPPALSNGVFVHPFVVRAMESLGAVEARAGTHTFAVPDAQGPAAWNADQLRAVAWVQQGPSNGLRFDAHQVVQAVLASSDQITRATEKVVLMEMYSATWCDTCLFGDRVAEEMAEEHGIHRDLELDGEGYLRTTGGVAALLAAIAGAAAMVFLPRRKA